MYRSIPSLRQVAKLQGIVSKSTISNWNQQLTNQGSRPHPKTSKNTVDFVEVQLMQNPFLSAKQLSMLIETNLGFSISESSVRNCIHKAGFTYKKSRYIVCKDGLDEKRQVFATHVVNAIDRDTVISIDESSVEYESPPRQGYSKRGQRLNCKTKSFHTKKWSILMAVSTKEVVHTWMINGTINSDVYAQFVQELKGKGYLHLMMDNASFHKTKAVQQACVDAGLSPLFLPAYSPWFQPIEHCFSVLKHHLRKLPSPDHSKSIDRMQVMCERILQCIKNTDLGACASFNKCWTRMTKTCAISNM